MPKLLFVGPYPPQYGGISSHLYDLLPDIISNGFKVYTISLSKNDKYVQNSGIINEYINK